MVGCPLRKFDEDVPMRVNGWHHRYGRSMWNGGDMTRVACGAAVARVIAVVAVVESGELKQQDADEHEGQKGRNAQLAAWNHDKAIINRFCAG